MRKQHKTYTKVRRLHSLLTSKPCIINQFIDDWGCKRLTSLAIRRFRTGQTNFRDTGKPYRKVLKTVSMTILNIRLFIHAMSNTD